MTDVPDPLDITDKDRLLEMLAQRRQGKARLIDESQMRSALKRRVRGQDHIIDPLDHVHSAAVGQGAPRQADRHAAVCGAAGGNDKPARMKPIAGGAKSDSHNTSGPSRDSEQNSTSRLNSVPKKCKVAVIPAALSHVPLLNVRRTNMPYTAEISRTNPSCFLFLIDQSGSMQDVLDPSNVQALDRPMEVDGRTYTHTASGRTKAQGVADAINRLLQNLVIKCAKSEGVRDYYDVGVIGYGGDQTANRVGPAFSGSLTGRDVVPLSDIANNPARIDERTKKVDDGAGGLVDQPIKFPIWFEPVANGGTPMCQAFSRAYDILSEWTSSHASSFPPIVINISDGEATDGDPTGKAEMLRSLTTDDGNVLLFNVHISSRGPAPFEFPDSETSLPDEFARLLFNISSRLPSYMQDMAKQEGVRVSENTRGFVFNADMVAVIRFLDIGTRPSNLR